MALTPRRGHWLAEILVALGSLLPILLLVAGMFPFFHGIDVRAGERWVACEIARAHVEHMRSLPLAEIPEKHAFHVAHEATHYRLYHTSTERLPGRLRSLAVQVEGPNVTFRVETRLASWR